MNERDSVAALWRDNMPGKWSRVEAKTPPGIPDTVGTFNGSTHWVEFKYVSQWGLVSTDLGILPSQAVWHHHWSRAGGVSWLFARVGNEFILLPGNCVRGARKTWVVREDSRFLYARSSVDWAHIQFLLDQAARDAIGH